MRAPDRIQEPPFTIKLELTEGCNLRCSFCAMNGIREPGKNNFQFLTVETAKNIAQQVAALRWRSRWELAMRGEPTMNPLRSEIVAAIRKHLPRTQIMMTSNGGGLLGKPGPVANIRALFDAGLNILALDDYRGANIVPRIRDALRENQTISLSDIVFKECPRDPDGNPYRRHKPSFRMLTFIEELEDTKGKGNGIRSHVSNQCGVAAPLNDSMVGKRCARPFRELAINHDGRVAICCNNWRGTYKLGSVLVDGVESVWQGSRINAARKKLYHGQRDFGPCLGCDSHSFRAGLLPDIMGKESLPKPDADDYAVIAEALAGEQYTPSVLREWEK